MLPRYLASITLGNVIGEQNAAKERLRDVTVTNLCTRCKHPHRELLITETQSDENPAS